MGTVSSYTKEHMDALIATMVDGGHITGNDLILELSGGGIVNAGNVRGPQGIQGPSGITVCTSTTRPTGGSLFEGLVIYETDTDKMYSYNGSTWVPLYSIIVCTSATRPTGGVLFEGLMIYETDTDRIYSYDGSAWVYRGGTIICTSSTRPSSPFAGLQIYETDTKRPYIYDGSAWVYRGGIFVCTSSTRPASPFAGLQIFETDTNRLMVYNGSAWRGVRDTRFSATGSAVSAFSANSTICTLTVADQGCAGYLTIWGHLRLDRTVAGDEFRVALKDGATTLAQEIVLGGATLTMCHPVTEVAMVAGSGKSITMEAFRQTGTGTATTFADPLVNRMQAIFIPDV